MDVGSIERCWYGMCVCMLHVCICAHAQEHMCESGRWESGVGTAVYETPRLLYVARHLCYYTASGASSGVDDTHTHTHTHTQNTHTHTKHRYGKASRLAAESNASLVRNASLPLTLGFSLWDAIDSLWQGDGRDVTAEVGACGSS